MGKANIEDKLGITKASPKNFILLGYFLKIEKIGFVPVQGFVN